MTIHQARALMPRYLLAVTGLATSQESSLARRLAWVVDQVVVFGEHDYPEDLRPKIDEMMRLLAGPQVPVGIERHPEYALTVPASYLHPAQAKRVADIIVEVFESIVWTLHHGED